MPEMIKANGFVEHFYKLGALRTRAYEAHFPTQYVNHLRQLVKVGFAQNAPDSKDQTALSRGLFLAFLPERPYRKEFVPARHATIRRHSQEPADAGCLAGDMFCRDALQFQVAADSAVGIQQNPKWSPASAESCFARLTAPRQDAANAQ